MEKSSRLAGIITRLSEAAGLVEPGCQKLLGYLNQAVRGCWASRTRLSDAAEIQLSPYAYEVFIFLVDCLCWCFQACLKQSYFVMTGSGSGCFLSAGLRQVMFGLRRHQLVAVVWLPQLQSSPHWCDWEELADVPAHTGVTGVPFMVKEVNKGMMEERTN